MSAMYPDTRAEFGWEGMGKLLRAYAASPAEKRPATPDQLRREWCLRLSQAMQRNLYPLLIRWGIEPPTEVNERLASLGSWSGPKRAR